MSKALADSGPAASTAPWEQCQLHVGWAGIPQQSFQGIQGSLLEILGAGADLQHTDCLGLSETKEWHVTKGFYLTHSSWSTSLTHSSWSTRV